MSAKTDLISFFFYICAIFFHNLFLVRHFYKQEWPVELTTSAFHKSSHLLIAGFSNGVFTLHEVPDFIPIHTLRYLHDEVWLHSFVVSYYQVLAGWSVFLKWVCKCLDGRWWNRLLGKLWCCVSGRVVVNH